MECDLYVMMKSHRFCFLDSLLGNNRMMCCRVFVLFISIHVFGLLIVDVGDLAFYFVFIKRRLIFMSMFNNSMILINLFLNLFNHLDIKMGLL